MRNSMKALMALAAVLVLFPFSDAMAQRRRGLVDVSHDSDRHGFWLTLGLGAGTDSYKYENVPGGYGHDLTKPSVWIAAGGTVNPHLRLGGEVNAWIDQYNDAQGFRVTETLVGGLLTGQVFPARKLGLFLKGGLGISRSATYVSGDDTGETGFAYLGGAGYEIKLGRNIFLTPAVNLMYHRSSPGRDPLADPDNLGGLRERVITIGVGLTFQPGR
jgi:hypothetical protein